MFDDKIHIALAADENYLPGLEVTRMSMERSCRCPERLAFHIFQEEPALAARIRSEFGEYKGSVMAFVRLYLPEILPEVDWIVYSDVDTIWNRDVSELWDEVTHQPPAAARQLPTLYWVRDMWSSRKETSVWQKRINPDFDTDRYGCSGVTVMNLKRMRETDFLRRAVEFTKRHGLFRYVDQDILNALCNNDCGMLPVCWDVLGCWEALPEDMRCVYHVTGIGRYFHAATSPVYPPQYQLWWNVRHGTRGVHVRSRRLARLWPLRWLAYLLPYGVRERIIRQMYFAHELVKSVSLERAADDQSASHEVQSPLMNPQANAIIAQGRME